MSMVIKFKFQPVHLTNLLIPIAVFKKADCHGNNSAKNPFEVQFSSQVQKRKVNVNCRSRAYLPKLNT